MYTLTTFRMVPEFAVGHVRDLRVRWALEEAGLPYQQHLIGPDEQSSKAYRAQQPFGQVPVLHDDDFGLFETGAILLHLGEKSETLLPRDPAARAQATMWMFAALNSVEPHLAPLAELVFWSDASQAAARKPALEAMALKRLGDLDAWLEGRDYLAGGFSVADILMTTVLRLLDDSALVERFARLAAYKARCTARPAFIKALASQVALYSPVAASA